MTDQIELNELIRKIKNDWLALEALITSAEKDTDWDDVLIGGIAERLEAVQTGIRDLKAAQYTLEARIAKAMPKWQLEADGTKLTRRNNYRQTWDHQATLSAVISHALDRRVPDADGVVEEPVQAVERAIRDCAGIQYWRAGALERYEMDVDKYRERENTGVTVTISHD